MADTVTLAVEGPTDAVICSRVLADANIVPSAVYGLQGKGFLDKKLQAYCNAGRISPWIILRDLDRDEPCAPALLDRLLPAMPAQHFRLQIAVHATEAWLLADVDSLSVFLGISAAKIPGNPEELEQPKSTLVQLARASRKRAVRSGIVPAHGSTAVVGPGYGALISEYASSYWRPSIAATRCASLAGFLRFVRRLKDK